MGGAAPVLSRRRLVAFAVLATALALYFALHERLPDVSLWWDVAIIGALVIPAVFATVWLLLPIRRSRWLWIAALVLALLAVAFEVLEWQAPASFAKLGAATFAGWILLEVFEEVSWVVAVALMIPWVDAYSVWRGPTNTIVEHHKGVFERLSFAFPAPGQESTANLGIPDILFFAVFLAAADRFGLRVAPDVVADGGVVRRDDRARRLVRSRRPTRAAAAVARVPERERRPALAPGSLPLGLAESERLLERRARGRSVRPSA